LSYAVLQRISFAAETKPSPLAFIGHPKVLQMKRILFLLLVIQVGFLYGQKKPVLSGYLKDATSGEALIGANVVAEGTGLGVSTNAYGFYSLSLPASDYTIKFYYLGYETETRSVSLKTDLTLNVQMKESSVELQEVVVSEDLDKNVKSVEMSTTQLTILEVKAIPQLLGEVDVIRSILLLPGVTTVGEGASGFNVRGGNIDQNLILLDEAPVYNSSHLFGFFSIFNGDAVRDLKLYKGGIPAEYGGRLSSALDVRQKEGNSKAFHGTGGIGVLSSRLMLEGPIVKDKCSFMVAGRRSYADLFLKLASDPDLRQNQAYFYDLNAKVNYQIDDRNSVFLSAYFGRDIFSFSDLFRFSWGNKTLTLRWNHLFSDKLFSNFTVLASDYDYSLGVPTGDQAFDWISGITNIYAKADFSYYLDPQSTIRFGGSMLYYGFDPGKATPGPETTVFNEFKVPNKYAVEPGVYASLERKIGTRFTILAGLRYSHFLRLGEETIYIYDENKPKSPETIIDSVHYANGEIISSFNGLEPRLSANYLLDDESSVKLSYNRTRQYIHLVSNTTSATPIDVWTPSGPYVKPAYADQVAGGYFRNFRNNRYELSAELYYKKMYDLLDYKNGAELILNPTVETELLSGNGTAYGLELMLKRNGKKWSGWISYTLSRSEMVVKGAFPQETINNGNPYPNNWDKTHDLSVTGYYNITKYWQVSGIFVYQTGRPVTYPDGKFEQNGIIIPVYNSRNSSRIPHYHRLDFSVTYDFKKNEGKNYKQSIVFGAYNVYARRNAFSIFFRQSEENPLQTEMVRLSILGSIVPFITYNFQF